MRQKQQAAISRKRMNVAQCRTSQSRRNTNTKKAEEGTTHQYPDKKRLLLTDQSVVCQQVFMYEACALYWGRTGGYASMSSVMHEPFAGYVQS
jgi:hypothetical protein